MQNDPSVRPTASSLGNSQHKHPAQGVNPPQSIHEQCHSSCPARPTLHGPGQRGSPRQVTTNHARVFPHCPGKGRGLVLPQVPAAALRPPQGPPPSELHDHRATVQRRKSSDGKWGGNFCRMDLGFPHRETTVKAAGLEYVTPVGHRVRTCVRTQHAGQERPGCPLTHPHPWVLRRPCGERHQAQEWGVSVQSK